MVFIIDHLMEIFVLPPGSMLTLAVFGFVFLFLNVKVGRVLVGISMLSLWLLSIPLISQPLLNNLQNQYPPLLTSNLKKEKNTAIVVLEAGLNMYAPEYGKPIVSDGTLTRIRYAAFLFKKTSASILVTGNDPSNPAIDQAFYMAEGLKEYFNTPTKWQENRGFNTAQEGILSTEMLKKSKITKIYLVTSAYHMPRAVLAFKNKGCEIIPAPTAFETKDHIFGFLSNFIPSISSLLKSTFSIREYLGILWYHIYYRI